MADDPNLMETNEYKEELKSAVFEYCWESISFGYTDPKEIAQTFFRKNKHIDRLNFGEVAKLVEEYMEVQGWQ